MSRSPETLGLPGLSAFVVGLARSGAGVASLLRRHGFAVRAVDQRMRNALETATRMERDGVECHFGVDDPALLKGMEFVVVSPGIPPSNVWLRAAAERGLPILGELEVASRFVRGPMFAVTGTNGKTTTSSWLAHLLKAGGRDVLLAGNIGLALSEVADTGTVDTCVVVEVSSFQLEHIDGFGPRAAAVLNVTPDHLDRYAGMDEYAAAKARIFENQGEGDLAVLNAADPGAMRLESSVRAPLALFDARGPVGTGAGLAAGTLTLYRSGDAQPLLRASELALPGPHNLENALAAAALTLPLELDPARVAQGLRDFRPLPHRLEPCGEIDGVRFVNDSKATNVDSMEKALQSFDAPILLVAGGRDKNGDFRALAPLVKRKVRALFLIGEAAPSIRAAYPDVPAVEAGTLEAAVGQAMERSSPGDVVLLSPGCASFDQFRDYEHRGEMFRKAVAGLAAARKAGA